jgi:two-component system, OmpR family, sensor histidine kinase KdpD
MQNNMQIGPTAGVAVAAALTALATGAAWAMDGAYSLASQVMAYLLAVVFAAFFVGSPTSIVTTVLAAGALNFFFIPPRYTFAVDREYLIDLGAMLAMSLVVSGLAARLRSEAEHARLGERRAQESHAFAEAIGETTAETELLPRAVAALAKAFAVPCCIVLRAAGGPPTRAVQAPETAAVAVDTDAAQWVIDNQVSIGPTTGNWPRLPSWYIPLPGPEVALGVIVVAVGTDSPGKTDDDRRHAEAFGRQLAVAIQRARLTEETRRAAREVEAESVRSALLASISHDFRTPLAVIIGAASTLAERGESLPPDRRLALLRTVENEAAEMNTMAENILQLARLSSGALSLRRDWESLEEIVGAVISRFRQRGLERRLRVRVPADLPLVRVDAVLVSQALTNLIDNAIRHAPGESTIDVKLRRKGGVVEVAGKDRGPGIGDSDAERLFRKFTRGRAETADGGVGLGLAIVKAVIDAHRGSVEARNRPSGGAVFGFSLPLEDALPTIAAGDAERTGVA